MAPGYSGTPLPGKLGIVEGSSVAILGDPGHAHALLADRPEATALDGDPATADVTLWFVTSRDELERRVVELSEAIFPDRSLWVAWPKRASGVQTNVTEDVVRELALPLGLVDNKVCAIDGTWSGLRLVWRRERRT